MAQRPASDPIRHTEQIRERLTNMIDHLREDIGKVDEPQALALMETTAEVLKGLRTAFEHYEKKNEAAWKPSEGKP